MDTKNQVEKSEETTDSSTASLLRDLGARISRLRSADGNALRKYHVDLELAHERLKKISDELKANFHICPQICQKLLSQQGAKEYYILLENDDKNREKTRSKFQGLSQSLSETEAVLKELPRLLDQKSELAGIGDMGRRRSIKNALENCKDVQDELAEWKKSARRSLEKIVNSRLPTLLELESLLPDTGSAARPTKTSNTSNTSKTARTARTARTKGAPKRVTAGASPRAHPKDSEDAAARGSTEATRKH